jgi:hypothetical protein
MTSRIPDSPRLRVALALVALAAGAGAVLIVALLSASVLG